MSAQQPINVGDLVVELAKAGGISLADERTLVAIIGGLATLVPGAAGHWLGIPSNVQTVALVAFAVIIASHLLGLGTHRAAVEAANGAVKQALIDAASVGQNTVVADSPADVSGVVTPSGSTSGGAVTPPPTPTVVDNVTPEVTSVGSGLPVVSAVVAPAPAPVSDEPPLAPGPVGPAVTGQPQLAS